MRKALHALCPSFAFVVVFGRNTSLHTNKAVHCESFALLKIRIAKASHYTCLSHFWKEIKKFPKAKFSKLSLSLSKHFCRLGFTWFFHAYASPTFSNLSKIIATVINVFYSH
jgi:hypothetical protein